MSVFTPGSGTQDAVGGVSITISYQGGMEKETAIHSSILAWRIPGQRSLVGYTPCSHEELDMIEATEHPHTAQTHEKAMSSEIFARG